MSLRIKYLLVLNGIILAMWVFYTVWSLKATEQQFMKAEVSSIQHLAVGLGLLVEHQLVDHGSLEGLQEEIASLLPNRTGLDILIVDRAYRVKLATQKAFIGERWYEDIIRQVFEAESGHRAVVVTEGDHLHVDRRVIDATIGVLSENGEVTHAIHVARRLDHLSGALNAQLVTHGVFAVSMLLFIGGAVNLLTYRIILRPLRRMNERLNGSGWLSSHPELRSGSELEQLGAVLDDALERIRHHTTDLNARLKRSERLAVIGRMASMLAHEIRNPMHIVRGTAETIARRFPDTQSFAEDIREEVDRVERLMEELLDYARDVEPRLETVNTRALLLAIVERVRKLQLPSHEGGCPPITIGDSDFCVDADFVMLEQALTNLLINAVEATSDGKPIYIRACKGFDGACFEVADNGMGISEGDLTKVLEPFFTRKARGSGLGLAIVDKIADLHNGSVTLEARPGGGTLARMTIASKSKGD